MNGVPRIETVMTIDDCSVDQFLYKRIMKRSGIVDNVISFQLAEEALAYLESDECGHIDAILLDINMPRMNGFEFLEKASNELGIRHFNCVVIMLTTSLAPADKARAKEFEVVKAYLNKPLSIEHLELIARLLPQ